MNRSFRKLMPTLLLVLVFILSFGAMSLFNATDGTMQIADGNPTTNPYDNLTMEEIVVNQGYSGACGDNVEWSYSSYTGILTISGEGEMYDYHYGTEAPWYHLKESIEEIVVEYGVTKIGSCAFEGIDYVMSITVAESVEIIGERAFHFAITASSAKITIYSPACEIFDDNGTLGCRNISGYPGSTTEAYANSYNKTFIPLELPSLNGNCGIAGDNVKWYCLNGTLYIYGEGEMFNYEYKEAPWYGSTTEIFEVVIMDGVTAVGTHAFSDTEIIRVVMSDSVTEINDNGFCWNNNLIEITLSSNLTRIGWNAFSQCENLKSVSFPEGLLSIELHSFRECNSLIDVYIPSSVNHIDRAFVACANLNNITVHPDNPDYFSDSNGVLFSKVTKVLMCYPAGKTENSYVIPNYVTRILAHSFDSCSYLNHIIIPNSVTEIRWSAFENCDNLQSIVIPEGVTRLEEGTFWSCVNLKSIILPSTLIEIEDSVFYGCPNIENVYFNAPEKQWGLISIGNENDCLLSSNIHFKCVNHFDEYNDGTCDSCLSLYGFCGDNVEWCFDGENLLIYGEGDMFDFGSDTPWDSISDKIKSIIIEQGVTSIGEFAFYGCYNALNISIPDSVKEIGYASLYFCDNLLSIFVDEKNSLFSSDEIGVLFNKNKTILIQYPIGKANKTYIIPDGVTTIRERAFQEAIYLENITIPDTVNSIGVFAFLDSGYYLNDSNWVNDVLYIDKYLITAKTSLAGTYSTKEDTLSIADEAFKYCKLLTNLIISNCVTSIGNDVFYSCENLISIKISNNINKIPASAFFWCDSLKYVFFCGSKEDWNKIEIQERNEDLLDADVLFVEDGGVFESVIWYYIDNTLYIEGEGEIPDGFIFDEETGDFVYDEETGEPIRTVPWADYVNDISKVVIGEGITSIGKGTFYSHFNLTDVELPSTLQKIDWAAFVDCVKLEKINLPDGIKTISGNPFHETSIKNITLPADLIELNGYSEDYLFNFDMCIYLESLTIPGSVGNVKAIVTPGCSSLRNIYNRSMDALIEFDEYGFGYWYGDEATAELMTISMSAAYDSIANPELTEEELQAIVSERLIEKYGSLENAPQPVLTDTVGQYITVYCYKNSVQHLYCVENGINYILIDEHSHKNADGDKYCDICGARVFYSGDISDSFIWSFDMSTGELVISGIGAMPDYKVNKYAPWYPYRDQITSVVVEEGVTSIGDLAFYKCNNITDIQLPDSVERIGKYAFNGCDSIVSMYIPSSVKTIDSKAFHSCNGLVEFIVSEDNQYFTSVDGVLFDKSVEELIKFPLAKEVTEYFAPDSIKSIGADSFNGCMYLTKISFYADTIKENAFYGCENLENVTIGGRVRTIEPYAFYNCKNLKELSIYSINLTIGDWAFYKCNNLETIEYKGSQAMWDEFDFGNDNKPLTKANVITGIYTSAVEPSNSVITFRKRVTPPITDEECKHNYETVATAPTCSSKGFTTYTCSKCGNSYNGDETEALAHSYNAVITKATCEEGGFTTYTCSTCGDGYIADNTEAIGHCDENSDGKCDNCEFDFTDDCNCSCHSNGIKKLLYKLIRFFWRAFRVNNTCKCGVAHY